MHACGGEKIGLNAPHYNQPTRSERVGGLGARIYSWIYFKISGDAYSVERDVPVDDEVSMMTS